MMFVMPVIKTSLFFLPKEESNILCKIDNSTLKSEFENKSKLKLAFFILNHLTAFMLWLGFFWVREQRI